MKRHSQRGIVLVITLLMLSVVTLMAVVFLSISRREKASVTVSADQTDARLMADAALARGASEVVSRILASTNAFNYDLMVSTNFISANGFQTDKDGFNPANVSYVYPDGRPLNKDEDLLQNLANLQYDPRPPVFIPLDEFGRTNEFRFFLDFNRNGQYEPSGLRQVFGNRRGEVIGTNVLVGDPEWIGVLERPDRPHSESNRFVGRYAFIILPAGKSLDLNFLHNNAKNLDRNLRTYDYSRNQGIGSWELNLAAFMRDLNTNSWRDYLYRTSPLTPSQGGTFDDAQALLSYRYSPSFSPYGNRLPQIDSVDILFNSSRVSALLASDGIDSYSDGPLALSNTGRNLDRIARDATARPWAGSPNPQGYYDVQEVFRPEATSPLFVKHLTDPGLTNSTYDRYTLYRMLAQLGTDSRPAESNRLYQADFRQYWTNKLHLNYRSDTSNGQTNFVSWDPPSATATAQTTGLQPAALARNPINFFYQTADRMLRANLNTNVFPNSPGPRLTAFSMGITPVRTHFSLTNIQIWHVPTNRLPYYATNNEYNATVHRLLQVAANIYDAGTTRLLTTQSRDSIHDYPSVFRPTFFRTATNLFINGYVEERSTNVLNYPWASIEQIVQDKNGDFPINRELPPVNIYGIPVVIGAKKGYPNFNEFSAETAVMVSRKLEVLRRGVGLFQTNQMHVIGISNIFGVEAWNSYSNRFQRPLELRVTNSFSVSLWHAVSNTVRLLRYGNGMVGNALSLTNWPGSFANYGVINTNSFILPIHTNLFFLTNSAYFANRQPNLADPRATNNFENSFDPPRLFLTVTNRMQYILIDKSVVPHRIIDFVNLDNLVTDMDISAGLVGETASVFADRRTGPGDLWNTNRTSSTAPTSGILNQIAVALGDPRVSEDIWRSHLPGSGQGDDKNFAIQKFREFFTPTSTNLAMQVPFTPARKLYQRNTWQVNDPLVHYTAEDLTDPVLTAGPNNVLSISPPDNPLPLSNLGSVNERYRPWGGNLNKPDPSPSSTDFRMSVKDPLVRSSDDWDFPTNKFASIGLLGRVHRGTPWQTIYLKAGVETPRIWLSWAGSLGTHPTNDWKLLDLFTVAPIDNAARGLLSVNQTNLAAWSAVLSGVAVLSNSVANPGPVTGVRFDDRFIEPNSLQLLRLVDGINRTKARQPGQYFRTIGDILATPELTVASPFLNTADARQIQRGLTDLAVERIPQQILSLLKTDEPRIVLYAFGQSLKPAERSLVTLAPKFFNICTNYQVSGEFVSKAVLRVEDAPEKPRVVMENFTILQPE